MRVRKPATVAGIGAILAILGLGVAVVPASAAPGEVFHSTGIELLQPLKPYTTKPDEDVASIHAKARDLIDEYPADFGYSQMVREDRMVVIRTATDLGTSLAKQLLREVDQANTDVIVSITPSMTNVKDMEEDRDIVWTRVYPGHPGKIALGVGDERENKTVFTLPALDEALIADIAEAVDPIGVAVRIDSEEYSPQAGTNARNNDTSPFYGGADIDAPAGRCSTAFPWESGSSTHMLTAGHCAPAGGNVSSPVHYMGLIDSGTRENWSESTGTVNIGGCCFRGDAALIRINPSSGGSSSNRIYRGLSDGNTSSVVREMWYRQPEEGDQYCTGGGVTGEQCGWIVDIPLYDQPYPGDGPSVVARKVNRGLKTGQCTLKGDSGGSVFTVRPDGAIAAKGIHSGSDGTTLGTVFNRCAEYFTSIREVPLLFPGQLRLG